ncbi:BA75_03045T0 [Komagataella pastoris]|uniref:BA75_03045T0 n=1 Tax=Komagataella pastoris TaxID=4922 RepID=A0A1B2JDS1_PICPA|nr:BA75_03045T0 [Komagataella pastoris]
MDELQSLSLDEKRSNVDHFVDYLISNGEEAESTVRRRRPEYVNDPMDIDSTLIEEEPMLIDNDFDLNLDISLSEKLQHQEEKEAKKPLQSANNTRSSILNTMLSPTSLGFKVATASNNSTPKKENQWEETIPENEKPVGNTDTQLRARFENVDWSKTPISLQMHHHHYYPPSDNISNYSQINTKYNSDNNEKLPLPWQSESTPEDRTPYIITSCFQLLLNFTATLYCFSLIYGCITTVKSDINAKMTQKVQELLVERAVCRRNWNENGCSPDRIVPALEQQCAAWEKCMNKDPYSAAGYSSISAETLGMIINSLLEPIGLKSFLFLLGSMAALFLCNFSFGFLRAKSYYGWNYQHSRDPDERITPNRENPNIQYLT